MLRKHVWNIYKHQRLLNRRIIYANRCSFSLHHMIVDELIVHLECLDEFDFEFKLRKFQTPKSHTSTHVIKNLNNVSNDAQIHQDTSQVNITECVPKHLSSNEPKASSLFVFYSSILVLSQSQSEMSKLTFFTLLKSRFESPVTLPY